VQAHKNNIEILKDFQRKSRFCAENLGKKNPKPSGAVAFPLFYLKCKQHHAVCTAKLFYFFEKKSFSVRKIFS